MGSPLVSIVIPLYNSEKYIQSSLESILNQTYQVLEVIVVNDGSTDTGPEIVAAIAKKDGRVQLYHQENRGQCAASNSGFEKTTGTYVKFFDADDLLSAETVATQVALLQGKGVFEASYIDYIRFYDDDLSTVDRYKLPALIDYNCSPIEYITFHGSPQMYQCGLWLFHRDLFKYSGLWDERLSLINDTEFFSRILLHVKKLYYATNCKLYYRTNFKSGSLSQQTTLKAIESALLSVDLMAGYVRSMQQSDTIEKIIAMSYADVLWLSYPAHPHMTKLVEQRLKDFPVDYYMDNSTGGYFYFIKKVIGWKWAKRLQHFYHKARYSDKS